MSTTPSNDFLPEGYETPDSGGGYMKFKDGENKIRILSKPLLGWVYWNTAGKPVRLANSKEKPAVDPNLIREEKGGKKPVKHFWALIVWNYAAGAIQVLEITQNGIQTAIQALAQNAQWGNPFKYDITITRKGSGLDTEYSIVPIPPAPVTQEIKDAFMSTPVNLHALMTGGDPFAKEGAPQAQQVQQPVAKAEPVKQTIPGGDPNGPNDDLPF